MNFEIQKRLKSKDLISTLEKLFYAHDLEHFRSMGSPSSEYSSEVKQFLHRLRFRFFLRSKPSEKIYGEKYKEAYEASLKSYYSFTKEEIVEELCRTWDSLFRHDGQVIVLMNGEVLPPRNFRVDRDSERFNFLAEETLKAINGEEVSFDTEKPDRMYCDSLIRVIKEVMDEQGYSFEEIGVSGQWEIDNMDANGLNELLFEMNPPSFLVGNNEEEKNTDEDK